MKHNHVLRNVSRLAAAHVLAGYAEDKRTVKDQKVSSTGAAYIKYVPPVESKRKMRKRLGKKKK